MLKFLITSVIILLTLSNVFVKLLGTLKSHINHGLFTYTKTYVSF